MKYIKNLKLFLEELDSSDQELNESDPEIEKTLKHINDFNSGKSKIDSILSNKERTDIDIESDLKKIIGEDENSNPFLSQYKIVAKLKRKLNLNHDSIKDINDKIKSKQEDIKSLSLDDKNYFGKKKTLDTAILKLNKQKSDITKNISELTKEIPNKERELKDKMSDQRKIILDKMKK